MSDATLDARVLSLVQRILQGIKEGVSDEALDELLDEIETLVPDAPVSDLIFYPHLHGYTFDRVLTAEEITQDVLKSRPPST